MMATEPPIPQEPQPQAMAAFPDRPWVWLTPGDPYWTDPPKLWRTEADLVISWSGNQRLAPAAAVDIASPGAALRSTDTILPAGTVLAIEARRFGWDQDPHVAGLIPEDVILLRLPDSQLLMLLVGYSYHPNFLAAAAAVVPVGPGTAG